MFYAINKYRWRSLAILYSSLIFITCICKLRWQYTSRSICPFLNFEFVLHYLIDFEKLMNKRWNARFLSYLPRPSLICNHYVNKKKTLYIYSYLLLSRQNKFVKHDDACFYKFIIRNFIKRGHLHYLETWHWRSLLCGPSVI